MKEHALLAVDHVIKGAPRMFDDRVVLVQQSNMGGPVNGVRDLLQGDNVVLLLESLCAPDQLPVYYRINTQGVFYFDDSGEAVPTDREGPVDEMWGALSREELVEAIQASVGRQDEARPPVSPPTAPPDQIVPPEERAEVDNPGCLDTPFA